MHPFRVAHVEIAPVSIALREPFGISSGAQTVARNVVVTVTLEGGARGQGEAAPFPAYNGETAEHTIASLESAMDAVRGYDARAWRSFARHIAKVSSASARCALECAVIDACFRALETPLWVALGGSTSSLETDYTVTAGDTLHAARTAARCAEQGFTQLKVKVGAGDLALDLARVEAVVKNAPGTRILLDGNAAFTRVDDAVKLAHESAALARAHGCVVECFEQPAPKGALDASAAIARACGLIVVADEDAVSCADVVAIARTGAASRVNLKVMKSGVVETLEMAATAHALGLDCMIGGLVESEMAMSVSAAIAAGLGRFAWLDLDTPLFLDGSPMQSEVQWHGPLVRVHARAGHGTSWSG